MLRPSVVRTVLLAVLIGNDLRGEQNRFQNFFLLEAAADGGQIGPDAVAVLGP